MARVAKVEDDGLVAVLHLPHTDRRSPTIIVLGGSDGGLGGANYLADALARSGFAALALAYFAMQGLPDDLSEVPLEYFGRAIDWVRGHPAVDGNRVGLLGGSRGGEGALLVASTFPGVHAVVANVPSHLVWQGTVNARGTMTSGWSVGGTPLPYAALGPWREGASWREQFDAALVEAPADAEIPVERINGPILFISGTDDGVWPCSAMADAAVDRLARHHFGFEVEHARYEHGGHVVLTPPYRVGAVENPWPADSYRQPRWLRAGFPAVQMGGTSEGNRLARMDAWPKMISFLERHL